MVFEDTTNKNFINKIILFVIVICVVLTAIAKYTQSMEDGDLWFHLAYARYMIQNHTLILDHTIFSWTPTSNDLIYCAWIPEIFLYTLYKTGGISILLVLKYFCIIFFIFFVVLYSWKNDLLYQPVSWLICLLGLLMSFAGIHIKPQIFSYLLITIMVFIWISIKSSHKDKWWLCYLFPVTMMIWINCHGGVIFGMTFLGVIFVGEILNGFMSPKVTLKTKMRKHFFISIALCGPAALLNPYGWKYPLQLIQENIINSQAKLHDFMTVQEYQSIFHPQAASLHFVEYLILACIILSILLYFQIRDRKLDWALILVNLVFAALYVRFIRVTYFWAVIFVFSALYLLTFRYAHIQEMRRTLYTCYLFIIMTFFFFLVGQTTYDSWKNLDFGSRDIYVSPVEEAEFIKKHLSGIKMGNDYESGAYLLWALYPETKIFIDARYYPYKEWYGDYNDFCLGKNVIPFLKKCPCDLWCLTYKSPVLNYFITSPEWKLIHYGSSVCLFARKDLPMPDNGSLRAKDLSSNLDIPQATRILLFSLKINDINTAREIVHSMKGGLLYPQRNELICKSYLELGNALESRNLIRDAIPEYQKAASFDTDKQALIYVKLGKLFLDTGDSDRAIEQYLKALDRDHKLVDALQNLAIVHSMRGNNDMALQYLRKIITIEPNNKNAYYNMSCIYAKQHNMEESIKWLKVAIEKGFDDWLLIKQDKDLKSIRSSGYYQSLFKGSIHYSK
ncbi:MAG TPA: tetratricopeptide repeat protein [Smithella sp.]|nr:tetratricopeptide repeat protein [Smithella sp.]